MTKFNQISFIRGLLRFSPRQLANERRAANYIVSVLRQHGIPFTLQRFQTTVPEARRADLFADGRRIPCQNTGYVGGEITTKSYFLSSLIPSRFFIRERNINFNPACPRTISCSNFYFAPSVAIPRNAVKTVLRAKRIRARTVVVPRKHRVPNILVGNRKNPRVICFAHYDSINKGAIDNASGVATIMAAVIENPHILRYGLFVFAANEELSYDQPTYWGRGYRVFERRMPRLLRAAQKIIVIDSLGYGPAIVTQDKKLQYLAFPIRGIKSLAKKTYVMCGDFDQLMTVYHSDADDVRGLDHRYLEDGVRRLIRLTGGDGLPHQRVDASETVALGD